MPQHHEVPNVVLAVELAFGEVFGGLALAYLVVNVDGSGPQYRAGGLGHVDDFGLRAAGVHGVWDRGGEEGKLETA